MPPAIGLPQKKVFEHVLRFPGRKWSSTGWTRYPRIDAVGRSLRTTSYNEPQCGQMKLTSAVWTSRSSAVGTRRRL